MFPFLVLPTKHLFSIRVRSTVGFLYVSAQNWCACLWRWVAFGKDHQVLICPRRPMAKVRIYSRLRMVKMIFLSGIIIYWLRGICWKFSISFGGWNWCLKRQGRRRLDLSKWVCGRGCLVSDCWLHETDVVFWGWSTVVQGQGKSKFLNLDIFTTALLDSDAYI